MIPCRVLLAALDGALEIKAVGLRFVPNSKYCDNVTSVVLLGKKPVFLNMGAVVDNDFQVIQGLIQLLSNAHP